MNSDFITETVLFFMTSIIRSAHPNLRCSTYARTDGEYLLQLLRQSVGPLQSKISRITRILGFEEKNLCLKTKANYSGNCNVTERTQADNIKRFFYVHAYNMRSSNKFKISLDNAVKKMIPHLQ